MNVIRIILRFVFAIVVLGGAAMVAVKLVKSRHRPEPKPIARLGPLVEVHEVRASGQRIRVRAQGTVIPAREVVLTPEIAGRVVEIGPAVQPGGRLAEGELIARVDSRDYTLAVEQARAALEQATYRLEVEQGQKVIAEREWKLLAAEVETDDKGRALALREPQIRNAQAAVASANSALKKARISVQRTQMTAPFNAVIRQESLEIGQVVQPGRALATLVGTDRFWVQVSVPVEALTWIARPDANGRGGAIAVVRQDVGDQESRRDGRVIRLLSDLDPVGRLARLLIEIEDPMGTDGPPLLLGAFVDVEIEGRPLDRAIALPRPALRTNDRVWIAGSDQTLSIREVQVAFRDRDVVFVSSGIDDGEHVITSRLTAPAEGLRVRMAGDEPPVSAANVDPVEAESAKREAL